MSPSKGNAFKVIKTVVIKCVKLMTYKHHHKRIWTFLRADN